jgi:uncharacterized membrane protein YqhA
MAYPFLEVGRYMIFLAVLGAYVAAFACLVYGAAEVVIVILKFMKAGDAKPTAKKLSVTLLADVDLFLLGTVFYIVAIALYELFINENTSPPSWLVIHNLEDLKPKLINGIVLFLAIHFLQQMVDWDNQAKLLRHSISIALIIAALTLFEFATPKAEHGAAPAPGGPQAPAVRAAGEH